MMDSIRENSQSKLEKAGDDMFMRTTTDPPALKLGFKGSFNNITKATRTASHGPG